MFKSLGKRLVYCRNLLGLKRPEFIHLLGNVSKVTLGRWERDEIEIPPIQLERVVAFFNNNGINVSIDWIKDGIGQGPINCNIGGIEELNFDDITYLSFQSLKQNISDIEQFFINTEFLNPFISYGDYVIGKICNILSKLDKELCFVIDKNGITVGYLNYEKFILYNFKNETYFIDVNNNELKFGKIYFISKKY